MASLCYLVTGCAGFIGAKVAELLLADGHRVIGVDNLNEAYDPRLKQWRLQQLLQHSGFCYRQLDVADRQALEPLFARGREGSAPASSAVAQQTSKAGSSNYSNGNAPPFAAVINLAARAGVRASVLHPEIYYQTNCDGTLNLLEMCRRYGVKKFVLASTSSVYGADSAVPFSEANHTSRPLSPYAASKKAAEVLAYTYHYLHGLDVTVLRYFTVYGPAGRPDMSVFRFVRDISEGQPIVVFGDGNQSRDFTFVDDIARGTVAALRPLGYEVINLGGDSPIKLSELISRIAAFVGREPVIVRKPAHPADVPATWADITKARQLLDWEPRVSIEEGILKTVQWYRDNRELVLSLADCPL
jgi:nucleoside-diphosphate-sugar epimerase